MRTASVVAALAAVIFTLPASRAFAQEHQHPVGERLGTVSFQTSCTPAAQQAFNRAMALLHSFEFGPAIAGFETAAQADASCGIAWWGIAIARWTNPFAPSIRPAAQLQQGIDAIERGRKAGTKTQRERDYLEAAAHLYVNGATTDQRARVLAYEKAMSALAAKYPADREATIFWALSLTASALPTDKTYANQLKAGAILEKLFPLEPDHPGITHYIIHSYDAPALAAKARDAAHRYAKIAPSAPHALHMPSHTFTRVGDWVESIETNRLSADAARKIDSRAEELHALDYMVYAYLQTGQDRAVDQIVERLPAMAAGFDPTVVKGAAPGSAGIFAMAAIPARRALERRDWAAAAKLDVQPSRFLYPDAMTHFARALGAAQTGAVADARASVAALQDLSAKLAQAGEAYWAEQVRIQHDAAQAFVLLAEGKSAEAVKLMSDTAAREDATDKNAVTPGPLVPARELLGEMLLQLKEPGRALKEFQATLAKEPRRFRAVYGAAKAASLSGDRATSARYFRELLEISKPADSPGRPELAEARQGR
jgi:hypothetical protein